MKDYRNLIVWQKGHQLILMIYHETKNFQGEEKYGITSQMRRAAVSIPTNIAEGCGKFTQADFVKFLQIALGSIHEVEYLNFLSTELQFQRKEVGQRIEELIGQLKAMVIVLIKKIRKQTNP